MDFYLNIATITKAISDYNNKYNILDEQKANIVSTVNWLAAIGWSGDAKDKFLEVFQEKMKLYEKLQEDIQYMISALEEEKQRALPLKTRCEDFVNCIERSGQGGSITGNDEGIVSLDYSSQSTINNYVNNCTNDDYVKLNSNFSKIDDILSELEFTSFGISGDVDTAKTSVDNQTVSLTEFNDSFNTYYNGVKDMESNICTVFSKISGISGGLFKNSSIISSSGDVDKNKLRDAMLKNEDGLTDEEKENLNYIEKVLGQEEYNKLKDIMAKNPDDLTDEENLMLENVKNIYDDDIYVNDELNNSDSNLPQWAQDRIEKYTEQLNSADNDDAKKEAKENIQAIKRLAEGGYSEDRIKTVLYALDNAKNTSDHDGYYYFRQPNGSDCADFVSQSLNQAFDRTSDWYFWGVYEKPWYDPKASASEIGAYLKQFYDEKWDESKEWVEKVNVQASESWLKPGALRSYFSDGTHGEAVTTLKSTDDIVNAAKNGLIKPGYIATMGSKTVSDSHAIIITDVDTETGTVYYSAHSTERMNRDLSKAFTQDDPEDHIYIVKPNYSDGQ